MVTLRGWQGLPKFSQDMYKERYFLADETYEKWLVRMSKYSDDKAMAKRIMRYISSYWFHPSTPISSNGNAPERGLPISCYVNEVPDTKQGIFD
jgi:ribonucleoside-diphosphate reductase alpha chain